MKDYFFITIRSNCLAYLIWSLIGVCLTTGCAHFCLNSGCVFGIFFIFLLGLLAIYFSRSLTRRLTRRVELHRGISRHFDGRKIKIEAIIGSLKDKSQSAIVRMGNTFLRFDIQCMEMEQNLEYTIFTNPVSALDVVWCVDKKVNTRKKFVQVLQDNGVDPGEIDSKKLDNQGNNIYTMPCGEDFVAISYPYRMRNRVVLIKKDHVSVFISMIRLIIREQWV